MDLKAYTSAVTTFKQRLKESSRFHMGIGDVHQTMEALAQELDRAGIDYAVVGGMALNAFGYKRETVDVDVLVRPEGLRAFHERYVGLGYHPAFEGARKKLRNTRTGVRVEFLTTGEYPGDGQPKPLAFPDPAAVYTIIDGVKVANLATLISLKIASGMTQPTRRLDLADAQKLIQVLGLDESFAEQLHEYVRPTFLTLLQELREAPPEQD
ncbi:MAG TPA: hypothetical protein VGM03_03145 [Phycisphaerae bacterium]|jgi:hypothetical protein